jgi:hypothetical protein
MYKKYLFLLFLGFAGLIFLSKYVDWGWIVSMIAIAYIYGSAQISNNNEKETKDEEIKNLENNPTVYIFKIKPIEKGKSSRYSYKINDNISALTRSSVEELARMLKLYALEVIKDHGQGGFKYIFSPPYDFYHAYPSRIYYSMTLPLSDDEKKLFMDIYHSYTVEEYLEKNHIL